MRKATARMARLWDKLPARLVDHLEAQWSLLWNDVPRTCPERGQPGIVVGRMDTIRGLIPLLATLDLEDLQRVGQAIVDAIILGELSASRRWRHGDRLAMMGLTGNDARRYTADVHASSCGGA